MKKVLPIEMKKIWGVEYWIYSSLSGYETTLEDGTKTIQGPLIKIIKADLPLSVQVHPDDEMAQRVEGQLNGKSESWYVLKAKPGSSLVVGLKNYDKQDIVNMLEEHSFNNNLKYIDAIPKQFINIPAGLVHGLGGGVTVFEVQQSSDVTYRYYDYDRLEPNGNPRELHIEKALEAQKDISHILIPISNNPLTYKNDSGIQKFFENQSYFVKEKSVVINLETRETFIAENEKVNFSWFAVVQL